MNIKFTFLVAILIFIAGLSTYFFSAQVNYNQRFINAPFVITYSRYRKSDPTKTAKIVQFVNSRGASLSKLTGQDGRDLQHMVNQYDDEDWKAWADREAYLKSTKVTRTEQIHGITAYIFRQDFGEGRILETWYAPETGPIPVKEILEKENGDAFITEAIGIEFREISDEELLPEANLLVNFTQ